MDTLLYLTIINVQCSISALWVQWTMVTLHYGYTALWLHRTIGTLQYGYTELWVRLNRSLPRRPLGDSRRQDVNGPNKVKEIKANNPKTLG